MGYATDHSTGTAHGHVLMSPAERRRVQRIRRSRQRDRGYHERADWHPEAGNNYGSNRAGHRRHAMESRRG